LQKQNISTDLAIVRDGGTASDTFKTVLISPSMLKKWGYDRFWLAEHHNMPGIASSATSILIDILPQERLH
jgi:hypothetical protein